ncbi:putative Anti-H(O) lectin 2 [Cocos nucifera]|uniref:Putative Anti-H(O) lectin 2 n=1 Tax=Cocos nucifera TaxID=13894 RepID=A0A8K0HWP8_COCNU|nr:putative Anti-H(O) lectin 2 [Cocos nucifera]
MALSNSRTPPSLQLLLLLFHLLAIQIPLASPLSFNYSGTDLNFPNMIYQGDAFFDGDIVQLTKVQAHANLRRSSGRMVYPEPVTIYDEASVINFTSCFSFFIYGFKKVVSADGLAFFLSSYPSEIPELSCGGTLGLFTSPDGIITYPSTVVAVEFDTFFNPQYNDISANHIGIDVHTINSTVQLDLNTSLSRNTTFNACVDYKATTKNLSVFLTNASDPTRNWSLSHVVDLRKVLPAKVAIGFTAATGKASKETDVFSFGIVILEIACGRKPTEVEGKDDKMNLVEWVWELYGNGKCLAAADRRLGMEFDEEQMVYLMVVGLWCAHPDRDQRPSMRQAINVLKFDTPLPALPHNMPVAMFHSPPRNAPAPSSNSDSCPIISNTTMYGR